MSTTGASSWLYFVLIPLAVFAAGVTLVWLTAMWEKRLIWPYVPATEPEVPSRTSQTEAVSNAAQSLGFTHLGLFRDGKGKLYNIRYELCLSPETDVLAIVSNGTIASMPVQGMWLHTLLNDGRRLVTVDNQAGSEIDLTNLVDEALVSGASFAGLLDHHRSRAASAPAVVSPFSRSDPLGDLRASITNRVDRMARSGYARFLDAGQSAWKYTAKGALLFSLRAQLNGLRRAFSPDKPSRAQVAARR